MCMVIGEDTCDLYACSMKRCQPVLLCELSGLCIKEHHSHDSYLKKYEGMTKKNEKLMKFSNEISKCKEEMKEKQ